MLIDKTYFQADISIPNQTEEQFDDDLVQILIESKSVSLLESILGHDNMLSLQSNLETNQIDLKPDADQKWINLVEGTSYTKDNQKFYYRGLRQQGELYKTSIIADFVFCEWLRQTRSQQTGIGEAVINAQNATNVSSTSKLVTIWNRFICEYGGKYYPKVIRYCVGGVPFNDYFNGGNANNVSLTQYLRHFEDLYPDCPLELPVYLENHGIINSLGI